MTFGKDKWDKAYEQVLKEGFSDKFKKGLMGAGLAAGLYTGSGHAIDTTQTSNQPTHQTTKQSDSKVTDTIRKYFPPNEIKMIEAAIKRNPLEHPDVRYIVYAIRKSENGGAGKEFGIMNDKAYNFDKQAGWCVATVNKNYIRWKNQTEEPDFIQFLQKRYAPLKAENDPTNLNVHWLKNVHQWLEKLKP